MYDKILNLTKTLVGIPSQNKTEGERKVAEFIYNYLTDIPYFKEHPSQVITVTLKDDPLKRMNIFALLKGEKSDMKDTIILHGHTDTVGTEDFGKLKEYATDCDKLMEELKKIEDTLSEEVKEDLNSGDYLFGRGSSDMKSGVANNLTIIEEFSKNPEALDGNILVMCNPVEESLHTGIIESLDILADIKEKFDLEYKLAINNDFICGMYPGDETKYIYTGSVGKLLPSFYIKGKETHVGQAYEGFDASMVAANMVDQLNYNSDYCDGYNGEYPAPPIALRMQELKPYYSVQTPLDSYCYFNYMVHNKNVSEVLDEMKEVAKNALNYVSETMDDRYKGYCKITGIDYKPLEKETQVLEYKDVYLLAKEKFSGDLDLYIDTMAKESIAADDDQRETSLKIVRSLTEIAGITIPTAVVFFSTPHCPHNTLKPEVPEEIKLRNEIEAILDEFGKEEDETFKVMNFFPSLTDSSYLKIDDDDASIKALEDNFPKQDLLYPVPYKQIRNLNIPGINFGTFGKDAHKWTERVQMSYSFGKLPKLMIKTINYYLTK